VGFVRLPDLDGIRNVLSTERVLVADITKVALSSPGGALKVTERRPPSYITMPGAAFPRHHDPGERYTVTGVQLGLMASFSGSRCEADDAADLIAAAAGLPALPRRDVSRTGYLGMIPAGIAMIVLGTAFSGTGHPLEAGVFNGIGCVGAFLFIRGVIAGVGLFIRRRRTAPPKRP
jgi:hypothetical protein